jgi:hypothetical protein
MDNTPKHIKKCWKAVELQKLRGKNLWIAGDVYVNGANKTALNIYGGLRKDDPPSDRYHPVWIPRQDQLQELITDKGYVRFSLVEVFYHYCMRMVDYALTKEDYDTEIFNSMDELWLAFTMHIRFKKRWSVGREDWIDENDTSAG